MLHGMPSPAESSRPVQPRSSSQLEARITASSRQAARVREARTRTMDRAPRPCFSTLRRGSRLQGRPQAARRARPGRRCHPSCTPVHTRNGPSQGVLDALPTSPKPGLPYPRSATGEEAGPRLTTPQIPTLRGPESYKKGTCLHLPTPRAPRPLGHPS